MVLRGEIDENSTAYIGIEPKGPELVYQVEKNGGLANTTAGQKSNVFIQLSHGVTIDESQVEMANWASMARPGPSNMGPRSPWASPSHLYCLGRPGRPTSRKGWHSPSNGLSLQQAGLGQPMGPSICQDGLTHYEPCAGWPTISPI